jgi:ribosome-binding ATPase YchF (GTP1/OBG family)
MPDYPPYVNNYGKIPKIFAAIKEAAVPPKFNVDFLTTVLEFRSSSDRAFIPLLKRLGFVDQANVPTQAYKDLKDDEKAKAVMASHIKEAYSQLYTANEYAHKMSKEQLTNKIRALVGSGNGDSIAPTVASTFTELCKLADFEQKHTQKKEEKQETTSPSPATTKGGGTVLGLSYTINLNLPATTDVEVFNAIFKSLKEHILEEKE